MQCLPGSEIIDQVAKLVAKSLVAADVRDAKPRLRLLETARAYALTKLAESGEIDATAQRYRGVLLGFSDESGGQRWWSYN